MASREPPATEPETQQAAPALAILSPGTSREVDIGRVWVHIFSDVRLIRADNPTDAEQARAPKLEAFRKPDVLIDLSRVKRPTSRTLGGYGKTQRRAAVDAFKEASAHAVATAKDTSNCGLRITGRLVVGLRGSDSAGDHYLRASSKSATVLLVLQSRALRDTLLWLVRARVAPLEDLEAACGEQIASPRQYGPSSIVQALYAALSDEHECGLPTSHCQGSRLSELDQCRNRSPRKHSGAVAMETAVDQTGGALMLGFQAYSLARSLVAATRETVKIDGRLGRVLQKFRIHTRIACQAVDVVLSMRDVDQVFSRQACTSLVKCWDALLRADRLLLSNAAARQLSEREVVELEQLEKKVSATIAMIRGFERTEKLRADVLCLASDAIHSSKSARVAQETAWHASAMSSQAESRASKAIETAQQALNATHGLVDDPFEASVYVPVPCSNAAARGGSPQYEEVVKMLLSGQTENECTAMAVTSIAGQGGAGKTTTCVLCCADERIIQRYPDGVLGIEVGRTATPVDLVPKIALIVESCNGLATAKRIRESKDLGEAVAHARLFFRSRTILIFLDNVWPGTGYLSALMRLVSAKGSRVLFTTRSERLAREHRAEMITLKCLGMATEANRVAASHIFHRHFSTPGDDTECSATLLHKALEVSQGLPLAIATIGSLARERVSMGFADNIVETVREQVLDPTNSDLEGIQHKGLYAAMDESLRFLDERWAGLERDSTNPMRRMSERYAGLAVVDRSHDRVTKYVLSHLWNVLPDRAEAIALEFHNLSLACYTPVEVRSGCGNGSLRTQHTLTLHDLQSEYSFRICGPMRCLPSIHDFHEMAVRGIFEHDVDIDSRAADLLEKCEDLCQCTSEDRGGEYVVSNLLRHLLGSITESNATQRWATVLTVMTTFQYIWLRQSVSGRAALWDDYIRMDEVCRKSSYLHGARIAAEAAALAEIGRILRVIPGGSRSWTGDEAKYTIATEIYRRLHATLCDNTPELSRELLRGLLASAEASTPQFWMRPVNAASDRPVADRRLQAQFRPSEGHADSCLFLGDSSMLVSACSDGVVRLHDDSGAVLLVQRCHTGWVRSLCAVATSSNVYDVFSVSSDGSIVQWRIDIGSDPPRQLRDLGAVVLDRCGERLRCVASNKDGSVLAAGSRHGGMFFWFRECRSHGAVSLHRVDLAAHSAKVTDIALSEDGTRSISASEDGFCKVWNVRRPHGTSASTPCITELNSKDECGLADWLTCCSFTANPSVVVTGHASGVFRVWCLESKTVLRNIRVSSVRIRSCCWLGDDDGTFAVGAGDGITRIVRTRDRSVTLSLGRSGNDLVTTVAVSKESTSKIACSYMSGLIRIWDADLHSSIVGSVLDADIGPERQRHLGDVRSVSISRNGEIVVSGGFDGLVRAWGGRDGCALWEFDCGSRVRAVCIDPLGNRVVAGARDGTLWLLDAVAGNMIRHWKHGCDVTAVGLLHSEGIVWSGHGDGDVIAWESSTSRLLGRASVQHGGRIRELAVCSCGRGVTSTDNTGQVLVSDLPIRNGTMTTHSSGVVFNRDSASEGTTATLAHCEEADFRVVGTYIRSRSTTYDDDACTVSCTTQSGGIGVVKTVSVRYSSGAEERMKIKTPVESFVECLDVAIVPGLASGAPNVIVACGLSNGTVSIGLLPLTTRERAKLAFEHWTNKGAPHEPQSSIVSESCSPESGLSQSTIDPVVVAIWGYLWACLCTIVQSLKRLHRTG